jgi:hypothetical protein
MLVWSFKKIAALNQATGFVTCPDALGETLITAGDAQLPAIGATFLKYIEDDVSAVPVEAPAEVVKSPAKAAK